MKDPLVLWHLPQSYVHVLPTQTLTTSVRPMMECSPESAITESSMSTLATPSGPAVTLPRSPTCLAWSKHQSGSGTECEWGQTQLG